MLYGNHLQSIEIVFQSDFAYVDKAAGQAEDGEMLEV